jgi:hypothetical protein
MAIRSRATKVSPEQGSMRTPEHVLGFVSLVRTKARMLKACFGATLVFLVLPSMPAAEFSVQGTVVIEGFREVEGSNSPTRVDVGFSVAVSNCHWFIRTERPIPGGLSATELGTDGGPIYSSSWFSPGNGTGEKFVDATVRPGGRPYVAQDPVISLVWFAYASECYFGGITSTNRLEPLRVRYFAGGRSLYNLTNFTVPAVWSLATTTPSVPDHAVFFEDGLVRQWKDERDSWWRPPIERRISAPYENGYTGLVYTVEKYLSRGKAIVPERFQLQTFGPKPDARSSNDLNLIVRQTGLVADFSDRVTIKSFLPRIPNDARILEERFVRSTPPVFGFSYEAGGKWLDDDSVKKLPEYAQQLREQSRVIVALKYRPQTSEAIPKRARIILLAFVFAITLPFAYCFYRIGYRNRKCQKP